MKKIEVHFHEPHNKTLKINQIKQKATPPFLWRHHHQKKAQGNEIKKIESHSYKNLVSLEFNPSFCSLAQKEFKF